jgi:hypothetical protein
VPFDSLRDETLAWLKQQELIVLPLYTGGTDFGYATLLVAPRNAAFFCGALADLQQMLPAEQVPLDFAPRAVLYVAPPFRHTHFEGKQVVVHNRKKAVHEIFAYNLYPGPSAKKGAYGVLIHQGEREGWVTAHASTVQVVTPYDNVTTILHEGASGGGKSEMLEPIHREPDGQVLLGENLITGERRTLILPRTCEMRPVSDDMALCHPSFQGSDGRLVVMDAENAWFLRFNHITRYGTDPYWEALCCHPREPLLMLNMDGKPGATALIWEHIEDAPGKPCPNPRVIMPRHLVPRVVDEPVAVDLRSFGIRTPPSSREQAELRHLRHSPHPAAGVGLALATGRAARACEPQHHRIAEDEQRRGRIVLAVRHRAPRDSGESSAAADPADAADAIRLIPNQHIGVWKPASCPNGCRGSTWLAVVAPGSAGTSSHPLAVPLLGYAMRSMQIEGTLFLTGSWRSTPSRKWVKTATMPVRTAVRVLPAGIAEVSGSGSGSVRAVHHQTCLDNGSLADYEALLPQDLFVEETGSPAVASSIAARMFIACCVPCGSLHADSPAERSGGWRSRR